MSLSESTTPSDPPVKTLSTLLSVIGGLASLLLASGYIYQYAFYRAIGAAWLLRELTVGEITFGSAPPLSLVLIYALIAWWLPRIPPRLRRLFDAYATLFTSPSRSRKFAAILAVAGFASELIALNAGRLFLSSSAQDILSGIGLPFLAFSSATLLSAAVLAAQSALPVERERAFTMVLWFVVVGLILTPAVLGVMSGRSKLENLQNYEHAVVIIGGRDESLPVIYVGAERIYCLSRASAAAPPQILPIPWAMVRGITQPHRP